MYTPLHQSLSDRPQEVLPAVPAVPSGLVDGRVELLQAPDHRSWLRSLSDMMGISWEYRGNMMGI